ncbi:hypothetical protein LCGC14_0842340 [marine sediment metagenome]|uniref:Uncharacterized protein n=1 Tax=marine sediment metagenome TaxID=412755 RepID=A0A0F9PCR0_9ZZZZ
MSVKIICHYCGAHLWGDYDAETEIQMTCKDCRREAGEGEFTDAEDG